MALKYLTVVFAAMALAVVAAVGVSLISLLSGQKITDSTNGLRAIRGSEIYKLDLREDRFRAAELILEAVKKKRRVKEVPIIHPQARGGREQEAPAPGLPVGLPPRDRPDLVAVAVRLAMPTTGRAGG